MSRLHGLLSPTTASGALASSWVFLVLAVVAGLGAVAVLIFLRRRRRVAILLAFLLGLTAAAAIAERLHIASLIGPERLRTLQAMAARPRDPWPRGSGHVPLGVEGAAPAEKGYIEPGGAFSPTAGSFGVSFWVVGPDGRRLTTGDETPLSETRQAYLPAPALGVAAETPAYRATWRIVGEGRASLDLVSLGRGGHLEIVLRSVGPAGGPLTSIRRVGANELVLNDRWRVRAEGALDVAYLGRERGGWAGPVSTEAGNLARDKAGWCVVRIRLPAGGSQHLDIADGGQAVAAAPPEGAPRAMTLPGQNPRFDASLRAQVVTIRQAIFGREIAPGDPLNYPLPWVRDGAYSLVALARSGQTDRLRDLAQPFAKRDFFGGFGAEADAPGLALWALGETSVALNDPNFDRAIWPDVVRKVGLIDALLSAKGPVMADFVGPVVPKFRKNPDLRLVADPAHDGLIVGRMDWHRPIFYVNAVTYIGLRNAAALASRSGHEAEAARWSATASKLQTGWRAAFAAGEINDAQHADDRTAISGLWPGEIAEPESYRALLEGRWRDSRRGQNDEPLERPLWTYFTLAEAHQWLRLSRPERAWNTLNWFWDHQPAPGLYTLWEGSGEENSFGLWGRVRGWVRPPYVSPHYWAASEMLLLQLAMLADVEGGPDQGVLVIGSGVPAEWLRRPFQVSGIGTSAGPVGWSWDGATVRVDAPDGLAVRLGPAFPSSARVVHQSAANSLGR